MVNSRGWGVGVGEGAGVDVKGAVTPAGWVSTGVKLWDVEGARPNWQAVRRKVNKPRVNTAVQRFTRLKIASLTDNIALPG